MLFSSKNPVFANKIKKELEENLKKNNKNSVKIKNITNKSGVVDRVESYPDSENHVIFHEIK